MDLEQIERLLDLLDKKQYQNVKDGLQEEKGKIIQMQEHQESVLFQTTIENFFRRKAIPDFKNLYCYANGLVTLANGASIFQLKGEAIASFVRENENSFLKLENVRCADEKEIMNLLKQCRNMLGDHPLAVQYQQRSIKNRTVIYQDEEERVSHVFDLQQIEYMDTFLGKETHLTVSQTNPIVYGESDFGSGYVLGIRK